MSIGYTLNELARMAVEGEIKGNPQFVQVGESSPQQTEKIEELSNKVRTLVDKVSILERENRSLREKYRDALERLDEADRDIGLLMERYQSVVIEPGNVLVEPGEDDRHG